MSYNIEGKREAENERNQNKDIKAIMAASAPDRGHYANKCFKAVFRSSARSSEDRFLNSEFSNFSKFFKFSKFRIETITFFSSLLHCHEPDFK